MKKALFICVVFLGVACQKESLVLFEENEQLPIIQEQSDFVSYSDIQSFLAKEVITKGLSNEDCVVDPYIGPSLDTLMYIVNYGQGRGWKVISSDKRTPAILAEGDKGSFVLNGDNPGPTLWMQGVAEDMAIIRCAKDTELTFTADEIAFNRSFWTGNPVRIIDPPVIDDEGGHWEVTTTSATEVYDSLGHMVPKWDQGAPYNTYCPLKTDGSGLRAPAGCVAIAGAQVLYFLHQRFGVPEYMYTVASCVGDTGYFSQNFSVPSNTAWSSINTNYNAFSSGLEDVLIPFVGAQVNMEYGNGGSGADDALLRTNVFNPAGISCSRESYSENKVKTSLLSMMPVIVSAYSSAIPLFDWGNAHCFVIDGYKRTRIRYYHEHVWVPDDPASFYDPLNQYATYYTVTYSAPQMTGIKINWGWWTQWVNHVNDGWYTLTGDWYVVVNNEVENYKYYRKITYGFTLND